MSKKYALGLLSLLLFVLAIYYFFDPVETSWMLRCPFYSYFGILCPGCGSQRAIHALLHLDFSNALKLNPLLVLSLPLFIYSGGVNFYNSINKTNKQNSIFYSNRVAWIILFVIIFYWIARNIPEYPFTLLRPY